MKKSLFVLSFCIFGILFIFNTKPVYASLGSITYWESDSNTIGRWTSVPRTSHETINGFTNNNFLSYVNHARNQWRSAGISISSTSTNANLMFYGGNRTALVLREPALSPHYAAMTVWRSVSREGYWDQRGTRRTGNKISRADIYIVYESGRSTAQYRNLSTHELGHALGWYGHTTRGSSNVMYDTMTSITNLTTYDKRHLGQVY